MGPLSYRPEARRIGYPLSPGFTQRCEAPCGALTANIFDTSGWVGGRKKFSFCCDRNASLLPAARVFGLCGFEAAWSRCPLLLPLFDPPDLKDRGHVLSPQRHGPVCSTIGHASHSLFSQAEYSDSNRGITLSFTREKKSVTSISEKCEACPLFAFLAWIL